MFLFGLFCIGFVTCWLFWRSRCVSECFVSFFVAPGTSLMLAVELDGSAESMVLLIASRVLFVPSGWFAAFCFLASFGELLLSGKFSESSESICCGAWVGFSSCLYCMSSSSSDFPSSLHISSWDNTSCLRVRLSGFLCALSVIPSLVRISLPIMLFVLFSTINTLQSLAVHDPEFR